MLMMVLLLQILVAFWANKTQVMLGVVARVSCIDFRDVCLVIPSNAAMLMQMGNELVLI